MRAICFGCLILLVTAPAFGAPNGVGSFPDLAQCRGGPGISPEARIAGCDALIAAMKPRRSSAEPYAIRCSLRFDKDDLEGAIRDCSVAIKLDPKNIDALHTRAVANLSKWKNDAVIADCNAMLRLQAEDKRAGTLVLRGMAYSQKGDYDRAIVDFALSLQLRPGYGMAESGLRDAHVAKARLAAGQKLGDPRAWCDGKALPQEGRDRHELQLNGCTKLIESGRESPDALVQDYFQRAEAHGFAMHHDLAARDLSEVVKRKPDHAQALFRLGAICWLRQKYEEAIAVLTSAIKVDPSMDLAYGYRGESHAALGQFDLAIADFLHVVKLQPGNAEAHLDLCRARIGKGDYDGAVADCDSAIRLSQTSEATEGHRGKGDARLLKGDFAGAISDYDKALGLWPEYPEALYGRGVAKIRMGDSAGGKTDHDAAVKLKPDVEVEAAKLGVTP